MYANRNDWTFDNSNWLDFVVYEVPVATHIVLAVRLLFNTRPTFDTSHCVFNWKWRQLWESTATACRIINSKFIFCVAFEPNRNELNVKMNVNFVKSEFLIYCELLTVKQRRSELFEATNGVRMHRWQNAYIEIEYIGCTELETPKNQHRMPFAFVWNWK